MIRSIKSPLSEALESIAISIAQNQDSEGTWGLGIEPFYRISQTIFALRVLSWHGISANINALKSEQWLLQSLSNERLPDYTRTLAWPIYLFKDQKNTNQWNATINHLTDRLLVLQNSDGSWGHGRLDISISGSGQGHPFPTAISLLALSNCPKLGEPKVVDAIHNTTHWLLEWIDTVFVDQMASWAIALLALFEANTHEIEPNFFISQSEKLAYLANNTESILTENIPNAARHLDAPYILLTPAWVLLALSKLNSLQTLSTQINLVRSLLRLLQEDGRVGRILGDLTPHIYSAFNVYFALREFSVAQENEKLITKLIQDKTALSKIVRGVKNDRASIFIVTSVEGLKVGSAIQQNFESAAFDCVIWEQNATPSLTVIEALENATMSYDFAIIVLTADDFDLSRGFFKPSVRDNVIFEFGLFMGSLGRNRVFGIHPRGDFKVPSDLTGMIFVNYDLDQFNQDSQSTIASACEKILEQMKKLGVK